MVTDEEHRPVGAALAKRGGSPGPDTTGPIAGKTLIAGDEGLPVATITADLTDNPVWPPDTRKERAVYAGRLVVRRTHGRLGIGAALLDWVGLQARRQYDAAWVRVDVWTTNEALHRYYEQQGFDFLQVLRRT